MAPGGRRGAAWRERDRFTAITWKRDSTAKLRAAAGVPDPRDFTAAKNNELGWIGRPLATT